ALFTAGERARERGFAGRRHDEVGERAPHFDGRSGEPLLLQQRDDVRTPHAIATADVEIEPNFVRPRSPAHFRCSVLHAFRRSVLHAFGRRCFCTFALRIDPRLPEFSAVRIVDGLRDAGGSLAARPTARRGASILAAAPSAPAAIVSPFGARAAAGAPWARA